MSVKKILLGLSACIAVFVSAFFLLDNKTETTSVSHTIQESEPSFSKNEPPSKAQNQSPLEGSLDDIFESREVTQQIETAMQSYAEISKYPPHSQPIVSDEHINAFINASIPESTLPFPITGLDKPIQVSLTLEKYNYFFGDAINASISLSDLPLAASVSARAVLMSIEGEILAESGTELIDDSSKDKTLKTAFDTTAYNVQQWPLEVDLGVYVDVNGHPLFTSAPFRINTATATFESVGYSEAIAENLTIPVNLNVALAGYYYVAAILYSQRSDKPLIHLEAEGKLNSGLSSLNLNAHIQALKKGGDEGPYLLKNIRIERWSDEVIQMDVAGQVGLESYVVEGYSFDSYDDTPYIDPLNAERIKLMEGFSSL